MPAFLGTATSDSVLIPASQANFPEYVDLSNLPAEFWDVVTDGGGDIRCYSDSDLTEELPRDVVSCDTTSETGELHVKHDLSPGDIIYIDVDGQRSDYDPGDTFGAENVWSDYLLLWHGGSLIDSSGNISFSSNGGLTPGGASGLIGAATDFDGVDDYLIADDPTNLTLNTNQDFSFSVLANVVNNQSSDSKILEMKEDGGSEAFMLDGESNDSVNFRVGESFGSTVAEAEGGTQVFDTGSWQYLVGVKEGDTVYLYIDGVLEDTDSVAFSGNDNVGPFRIGYSRDGGQRHIEGLLEEARVFLGALSADLVSTKTSNFTSPSSFRVWEPAFSYSILGTVTLDGSPVQNATIRCIRQSDNVALSPETTDSNGEYEFSDLDENELYHLMVEYEEGGEQYNDFSYWDISPVEV